MIISKTKSVSSEKPASEDAALNLKALGLTPMLAQYFQIKKNHPDSLLFYRMGDFYELFFDDAIEAAKALDITLTKRGHYKDEAIPMCGVPFHAADVYLGRLIKKGYRVAICEQVEDPAEARKRGSKSVVKRAVARVITPGTVTEDSLLESRSNNFLACVTEIQNSVAVAWVDVSAGILQTQKVNPDQLGAVLARIMPSEILVSDKLLGSRENSNILGIQLDDWRSVVTRLPSSRFDSANGIRRLKALYQVASLDSFGSFSRVELAASGALVDYLELTQQGKMPRLTVPKQWKTGQTLEIDAATRSNLELLRTLTGDRQGSLLSCIDKTETGAGARLLTNRLSAPSTDTQIIMRRLDSVTYFVELDKLRESVRKTLKVVPDLERAMSRLTVDRGGPRDLIAISNALHAAASLRDQLVCSKKGLSQLPLNLIENMNQLGSHESLVELLTKALVEDPPIFIRDGGFIRSGYHVELDRLKQLKDERRLLIAALQTRYANDSGISSIKIKHNNVLGYFVEVTSSHSEKLMRHETFIHRQSMINATRFTTLELTELERDLSQAADKALALEQECFKELSKEILGSIELIIETGGAIAELDVASSLAELAVERRYVRPIVDCSCEFKIVDGRHPVVEVMAQNDMEFVSNDCDLQFDQRLWLITGPNMAGKSTFLRQNALIALMAHMGSYVPASFAKIGIIDRLFSRVGAADDLARGRSTFMVEMVETATILNQATDRSLVILDEIGRGTATFDGLSIAWAAIEQLHEVNGCRTLFATHYHELTALAARLVSLSCHTMKVKEWKEDIIFLHEVSTGTADRSYGIHVAKLAGLPLNVISRAKIILENLEKGEKAKVIENLTDDLPLFQNMATGFTDLEELPKSQLNSYLAEVNADNLTPREALDLIYKLKELAEC